ncbi:MAG: hypothetical protein EBU90_27095 [Proteobacteria bacterium]|jgi:hypothetical protein|nr:hypothetical protein [Pseudomonadota bacterium]
MSDDKIQMSQEISVTSVLVAILKTLNTVEVPSGLLLNPASEDTGITVTYNDDNQTFLISLGDNNGSN